MVGSLSKKLKYQSQNSQNIRSGSINNHIFDTYKNSVMTHGLHRYQTAPDMDMAKMCAYPQSHHALTHWKCLLCSCANNPRIDLPSQES